MPDIRYVCLSDLHFGAENSILSRLVEGGVVVDATRPSLVLERLVAAIRELIERNEDRTRRPTLVLNGDIIELALASDNVALMVFERFLDLAFPPGGEPLFDSTVYYQPGNHDHHLWETARERQYGIFVERLEAGQPLPLPWHATALYPSHHQPPVQADMLEQLARRNPSRPALNFRVSYPNLGVCSDDGSTVVVFHHGHFSEPIYHLMTTLKDLVFPGRVRPSHLWDIEAENFAWIDFFWSTLGRSGDVGEDVGLIYDMLQSPDAIDTAAGNLSAGLFARLPRRGLAGRLRWLARPAINRVVRRVATHLAGSERRTPRIALTDRSAAGLMTYLSGPLLRQLRSEPGLLRGESGGSGTLPEQLKFVFGHTHKPFSATHDVPGLSRPVRVFNSGGWVVDTLGVEPLHGANMVLVDENLEVACVRVYNQSADPGSYRVSLDDGVPEEHGPFHERLSALVDPAQPVWRDLSAAIAALVMERRQALAWIIAHAGNPRPAARLADPATPRSQQTGASQHASGSRPD